MMRQVDFYFDKILRFSYLTDNVTKTDIYLYLSSKCHSRLNPQLKIAAERLKSDKHSRMRRKYSIEKAVSVFFSTEPPFSFFRILRNLFLEILKSKPKVRVKYPEFGAAHIFLFYMF